MNRKKEKNNLVHTYRGGVKSSQATIPLIFMEAWPGNFWPGLHLSHISVLFHRSQTPQSAARSTVFPHAYKYTA